METRILIVDDDERLQSLLREYLESSGYRVSAHGNGNGIMEVIRKERPELIILDIMLPGKDGIEVLKEIRRELSIPVVMLTARGEDADRIVGLELGADDYLPKPFNPRELLARIRAIQRRVSAVSDEIAITDASGRKVANEGDGDQPLKAGVLELSRSRRTLFVSGKNFDLSSTEFQILEALMERPGIVLSRDELMNRARGREHMAFDRSIDVHISKIRARLREAGGHENKIKTIWGRGYMFVTDE